MTLSAARDERRVWAIVPAKRFGEAKMRLAAILTRAERARLARAMLHDVMSALHGARRLAGILVVTGDPSVANLVRPFGAHVINDVVESGLNDAVREGLRALAKEQDAGAIIIPGDVPFVTSAEVDAVLGTMEQHAIVLTPALQDGGTNCLAMRWPDAIEPCYGNDSFMRHQAAARHAGIDYGICRLDGLGRDIDRPEDLVSYPMGSGISRTRELLGRLNVPERLGCLRLGLRS